MTDTTALQLDPLPVRPAAARRSRLWRSVFAFLVSLSLLLAMTGVAVFAQTGAAGGPVYVPATAVGYGELRLDLPGDQHDQLAAFMAHFPGFADPSSFDTKLDQMLDQGLSSATGGSATWTGNIQTWSNGQVGVGVLALPATAGAQPSVVVGLGLRDRAALETQLTALLGTRTVTTEDYAGTTVSTAGNTSYAITDAYMLLSPEAADVKTALDVLAGTTPSLAADPNYLAARGTQPANDLGSFYIATAALQPYIQQMVSQQPGASAALLAQLVNLPTWISGYAQIANDHVAIGASAKLASLGMAPSVRATDLAAQFPADTLLYVETRDLGNTIDALIAQVKPQMVADAQAKQMVTGLEQQFGSVVEKVFDFADDGAVGVGFDGQHLAAGIVATLKDQAVGERRLQSLIGLLRLSGGALPADITTADVNGTTVTTLTFRPEAGLPANLPFDPAISVAIADGHLYLGLGDFAATALAQDPATSLATSARYASALATAGTPNAGIVWLDAAAAAPLLVQMAGADSPSYETNVKPWVKALDSFMATATVDADIAALKALLFVK